MAALRIGVVGAGSIGRRHVQYVQEADAAVMAICDPSVEAERFAQQRSIAWFSDHRQMLDGVALDAVIIATPNALHEPVAIACAEHRLPMLIEKPIAHSIASATRIAQAVRDHGVRALVGHHRRHNPLLIAARDFIAGGGLGRVLAVNVLDFRRKPDAYFDAAWRREPGGGPLLINGIHDIDCLRWLCGDVDEVSAICSDAARGFDVEDTAAVMMRFTSGALGTLGISDAVQAPWAWEIASGEEPDYPHQDENTYYICGSAASISVPTLTVWRNERGGGRGDPFIRERLAYTPGNPWVEELRHFFEVARGNAVPRTTIEDGTRTLATALAIVRSAEQRSAVRVDAMYGIA